MSAQSILILGAALALGTAGCTVANSSPGNATDKAAVALFADFQAALEARDGEKVLGLLDDDSRADAERAAWGLREAYAKADAAGKAKIEEAFGLSAAELAALGPAGFLKSRRFVGAQKLEEIPGSKFDRVEAQGDKATLHYIEDDGDAEKLSLVRQGGSWKLALKMPPATP